MRHHLAARQRWTDGARTVTIVGGTFTTVQVVMDGGNIREYRYDYFVRRFRRLIRR